MTPDNNKFNRDIGLETGRWLSMLCANHHPGYNKQKHILQLPCRLLNHRGELDSQLTPDGDFSKKWKHQVQF